MPQRFAHQQAAEPSNPTPLLDGAFALHKAGRLADAENIYKQILTADPGHFDGRHLLGLILHQRRQFAAAVDQFDLALRREPNNVLALNNRGLALKRLKRFEEALASYNRALVLRPDYAEALSNRGVTLHEMGRFEDAVASYQAALTVRPDYAEVHYCEALCRLLIGDFDRGWEKNEWRWQTEALRNSKRSFSEKLWLGSDDIAGKTILRHAEQGFGDTLQFARYVPMVAARGARVILEVQRPLHALMASLPEAAQVVSRGDALPAFDMHCPLLSLPLAFGTRLETIPSAVRYLAAPESKVRAWRDALGKHDRPRIGLVWAGNPRKELPNANRIDSERSMAFGRFAPLFFVSGCEFYSLQKGDEAVKQLRDSAFSELVIDRTSELHDFSDTAALIENLDLVIAVDTAVAHLSGALGKPFWLLNRYNTCWRWLLDRVDSPWYPAARQFRQDQSRDWDNVIARVCPALRDFVRGFADQ